MASPKVKKNAFIVANLLFWVIGLTMLAYTFWVIYSDISESSSLSAALGSTMTFKYVLLGISGFLGAVGLCGCYGGVEQSPVFLKIYMVLMILLLLAEIGSVVFLHATDAQMPQYVAVIWSEINTETRNFIQKQFQCCGFAGPHEYARMTSVDVSCYNTSADVTPQPLLNQVGCRDSVLDWFSSSTALWSSVLAVVALIQVVAVCLSCCVIASVERQRRVKPIDDGKTPGKDKSAAKSEKDKAKQDDEQVAAKSATPTSAADGSKVSKQQPTGNNGADMTHNQTGDNATAPSW